MTEKDQNEILDQELSLDELDAVSGGGATGQGGCAGVYYRNACTATVEEGSWCGSDDYCEIASSRYSRTDEAERSARSKRGFARHQ